VRDSDITPVNRNKEEVRSESGYSGGCKWRLERSIARSPTIWNEWRICRTTAVDFGRQHHNPLCVHETTKLDSLIHSDGLATETGVSGPSFVFRRLDDEVHANSRYATDNRSLSGIADLQNAERALDQSEAGRRVSEDKFQKIFHSSPVAFSITTLEEGRFLEVNAAFEAR
jgi:PAS domain-containing protein